MSTILFDAVLNKFIESSPVTVMTRGLLENLLNPDKLDQLFENHSKKQYPRDLLFSAVVDLMLNVVIQIKPTVSAAYQSLDYIPVSCKSVYYKLNGLETTTSAALSDYMGAEANALIKEMSAENPAWIQGYRTKLLDGNCIAASEHRLAVLRDTKSGPLPGKSLVVFDPQTEVAINVFPCENGHAQERSLLNAVLKTVEENDLWVADRNFCTQMFLFGITQKKAAFIIREHANMPVETISEERFICDIETGKVYEQDVILKSPDGIPYSARRIIVKLHKETRNGDTEIRLLTTLKKEVADAAKIAEIYKKRWGIETAFQRLEKHFNSEINTLGYPKAALFGFCLGLVAFNLYAVITAALRAANPSINIKEEVSEYYIANEINSTYSGMDIAVDDNIWGIFRSFNRAQMAVLLIYLAQQVDLKKFKKHPRKAKKPKAEIKYDPKKPHVSTFNLLSNKAETS